MANDKDKTSLTKDDMEIYKLFRERVTHEDTLIGFRTNWLVWVQTSLLATWLTVYFEYRSRDDFLSNNFLEQALLFIPILGLSFSVLTLFSIRAAMQEMDKTRAQYKSEHPEVYANLKIPRITATKDSRRFGASPAFLFPFFYILLCSFLIYWRFQIG